MRILIAPDKFRGSLSAFEAADAIAAGVRQALPDAEVDCAPIADGGEGTVEVIARALGGQMVPVRVRGPLGEPVQARYAWIPQSRLAVVEMSEASGLSRVRVPNPWRSSTFGTGELILDAAGRGAEEILVGIGGSATNDGGAGAAAAAGYVFAGPSGEPLDPTPEGLENLAGIRRPATRLQPALRVMSDVENPLLGPDGATSVFARQKGADAEMIRRLEHVMERLVAICRRDLGTDFAGVPGAGAAGGLGFGFLTFFGASVEPGFARVATLLDLEQRIIAADLVITGEGSLDAQTLRGKGPGAVATLARRHGKRVVAFAGRIDDEAGVRGLFDASSALADGSITPEQAVKSAASLLRDRAARIAHLLNIDSLML